MAHETLLRIVVNGLQNLAMDHQTLAEHLNLRALARDYEGRFEGAPFQPPELPYPDVATSQAVAADRVATIAADSALFLLALGGEPATPDPIPDVAEADLLRLIIDWVTIQSAVQKAIIQLYGPHPAPPPALTNPGAASEERLWAEIVAWLEKIAADSILFTEVQHLQDGECVEAAGAPLARMEQEAQAAALNLMLIAGRLPYHLFHAAHSAPQESARSKASRAGAPTAAPRGGKGKKGPPRRR
jgi:hypothetical protein